MATDTGRAGHFKKMGWETVSAFACWFVSAGAVLILGGCGARAVGDRDGGADAAARAGGDAQDAFDTESALDASRIDEANGDGAADADVAVEAGHLCNACRMLLEPCGPPDGCGCCPRLGLVCSGNGQCIMVSP